MSRLALIVALVAVLLLPLAVAAQEENPFLAPDAWVGCTPAELMDFALQVQAFSRAFVTTLNDRPNRTVAEAHEGDLASATITAIESTSDNCAPIRDRAATLGFSATSILAWIYAPESHLHADAIASVMTRGTMDWVYLSEWSDTVNPRPTPVPQPTSSVNAETRYIRFNNVTVRSCPRTTCLPVATLSRGTAVAVVEWMDGEMVDGQTQWAAIQSTEGDIGYVHSTLLSFYPPR
jgi:hypothetical protein